MVVMTRARASDERLLTALYRLHESGLATTIEPAAPVSEALQTLTLELE